MSAFKSFLAWWVGGAKSGSGGGVVVDVVPRDYGSVRRKELSVTAYRTMPAIAAKRKQITVSCLEVKQWT